MKISTFTIIKNEAEYIGYNIMSVLDYVDEMVFTDGNSTDGTVEIIKYIQKKYDKQNKIKLFEHKDVKNLIDGYAKLSDWTLKQCTGDYLWFLHADMICDNPNKINQIREKKELRYSYKVISIAGENKNWEIIKGKGTRWATIYKNVFGLKYCGLAGGADEDLYFTDLTGDEHLYWALNPRLPYKVIDTDILIYHYSDTISYKRRYKRMFITLKNVHPELDIKVLKDMARTHPRVNLQLGKFDNKKTTYWGPRNFEVVKFTGKHPSVFSRYNFKNLK